MSMTLTGKPLDLRAEHFDFILDILPEFYKHNILQNLVLLTKLGLFSLYFHFIPKISILFSH